MGPRESEEEGADTGEGVGPSFRAWVGAERGVRAGLWHGDRRRWGQQEVACSMQVTFLGSS